MDGAVVRTTVGRIFALSTGMWKYSLFFRELSRVWTDKNGGFRIQYQNYAFSVRNVIIFRSFMCFYMNGPKDSNMLGVDACSQISVDRA